MTPGGSIGGGEDLRGRALALIRKTAPVAFCDACLALRLESSLSEMTAALAQLVSDGDAARTRRACYGCGRVLEISAPRDAPTR